MSGGGMAPNSSQGLDNWVNNYFSNQQQPQSLGSPAYPSPSTFPAFSQPSSGGGGNPWMTGLGAARGLAKPIANYMANYTAPAAGFAPVFDSTGLTSGGIANAAGGYTPFTAPDWASGVGGSVSDALGSSAAPAAATPTTAAAPAAGAGIGTYAASVLPALGLFAAQDAIFNHNSIYTPSEAASGFGAAAGANTPGMTPAQNAAQRAYNLDMYHRILSGNTGGLFGAAGPSPTRVKQVQF